MGVIIAIGVIWLFYRLFMNTFYLCFKTACRREMKLRKLRTELTTDNIYGIMNFNTLKHTYLDTLEEIDRINYVKMTSQEISCSSEVFQSYTR